MKVKINGKELINKIGNQDKHVMGLQVGLVGTIGIIMISSIPSIVYPYNLLLFVGANLFLVKFAYHIGVITYTVAKATYEGLKEK